MTYKIKTVLSLIIVMICLTIASIDNVNKINRVEEVVEDIKINRDDGDLTDNPLMDLYHFIPFQQNNHGCNGEPVGVGFGSLPFQCSPNATGTMFVLPLFGTSSFNLTANRYGYCNDEEYTSTFDLSSGADCQYNVASNSTYYVFKQDWPVKIPPNSVLSQSMFALCSAVSSYWFATNGTTVTNSDGSTTTYFCHNQQPFSQTCYQHGCRPTNLIQQSCNLLDPVIISCT